MFFCQEHITSTVSPAGAGLFPNVHSAWCKFKWKPLTSYFGEALMTINRNYSQIIFVSYICIIQPNLRPSKNWLLYGSTCWGWWPKIQSWFPWLRQLGSFQSPFGSLCSVLCSLCLIGPYLASIEPQHFVRIRLICLKFAMHGARRQIKWQLS